MRLISKLIIILFLFQITNAQTKVNSNFSYPSPVIGWDSLKSLIERPENYPDILIRAGITTSIQFWVNVDSTGNLTNVQAYKIKGYDTLFVPKIKEIINSVKWIPGSIYGKYFDSTAELNFIFFLYSNSNPQFFLISAPKSLIKKSY